MTNDALVRVVDDDPAVRDSLKWMLELAGMQVQVYGSADEFLSEDQFDHPGCLVLDVRLPGKTGVELLEEIESKGCHLPVIIITGHADVPTAVRAFRGGALDFIEKPFDDQHLLERIRHANQLDSQKRTQRDQQDRIANKIARLTPREKEVMQLVVAGHPNKRIATDLSISPKTVEAHRAHVMTKMEADSLAKLVQMSENMK
jgi:two-component system, LuxR family, response regulator FixJ